MVALLKNIFTNNNFIEVLKNKNFLKLWGSQLLSIFSAHMVNYVLTVRIYGSTESSFSLSLLFLSYMLPVFLLGLFSGIFVDHFSRKKILIFTNLLQAFIVLFYLQVENVWWIYVVLFFYSVIDQFYYPAEAAMLPEITTKKELSAANGLFNFATYGAFLFGFAFGGPLLRIVGTEMPYIIACVLLLTAMGSCFLLPKDIPPQRESLTNGFLKQSKNSFLENFNFIKNRKKVWLPLIILLFLQMSMAGIGVIIPAFATTYLQVNLFDIGWKLILPVAFGAVIGALMVDKGITLWGKKNLVTIGIFGCGLGLFFFTLLGLFQIVWLACIILLAFPVGFFVSFIMIPCQTLIQESTRNEIRGRFYSLYKLLSGIALSFPLLIAGKLADIFDTLPIMIILSIITITLGFMSYFIRKYDFSHDGQRI